MKKCPKCSSEYSDTTTLCPSDGTALESNTSELVGRTLAGKYRIDEVISEGGMGTVYRATHILMDKRVAIKVLQPSLAADSVVVARFSREARAASRISHPHAISVTDFGESEDGIVFLVMEFLHGKTLKEIIRSNGPLPLPRVVEIMRQVCGALEAAHAENVIHRDLKSDNIMLIDVAEGDWVKVLDFGIAKIQEPAGQDPGLTSPDLIIGTPQYMSPEQCTQTSEIDARSDVYSLGVILYELLAGHVPFTGESSTTIMFKHLQEAPPDLQSVRGDLPRVVAEVVGRALAKQPQDRFQTVRDLRENLTIAAEESSLSVPLTADEVRRNERQANRIVIQTHAEGEPYELDPDLDDEVTVVHPSVSGVVASPVVDASGVQQTPAGNTNSWRVAAIALIGVLVIGGVLYAMTRSRQVATDKQSPPLVADPNSQPVKSTGGPTGHAENDIAPNSTTDNLNSNANLNTSNSNENQNSDSTIGNGNLNDNSNSGNQQNNNLPGANNSQNSNSGSNVNSSPPRSEPSPGSTPPRVTISTPPPPPSSTP